VFYETIGEQFEIIGKIIKENHELDYNSGVEDYKAKKYIIKESFKQVKLIFLHKYGVVI